MDYFDILFAKNNGISKGTCYNEIEAMLKSTVGHSSKNLLEIETTETQTINGVTFTVDKQAGTITANGTATQDARYSAIRFYLPAGNYYFLGCPNGGSESTWDVYMLDYVTNKRCKIWNGIDDSPSDYDGTKKEFQIVAEHQCGITLRIRRGQTVNNLVFKPMVWDGSISDDTFEPYVTPTDEKKQDKPVVLWEAALNSTGVSDVAISSLADDVSNYSYLKVAVTNEPGTTITDQEAVMTTAEYDTAYIGRDMSVSVAMLGMHPENGALVFDRLFIWVYSDGTNISVRGLRNHNDTSTPPDVVPSVFIRKIIGIPK